MQPLTILGKTYNAHGYSFDVNMTAHMLWTVMQDGRPVPARFDTGGNSFINLELDPAKAGVPAAVAPPPAEVQPEPEPEEEPAEEEQEDEEEPEPSDPHVNPLGPPPTIITSLSTYCWNWLENSPTIAAVTSFSPILLNRPLWSMESILPFRVCNV